MQGGPLAKNHPVPDARGTNTHTRVHKHHRIPRTTPEGTLVVLWSSQGNQSTSAVPPSVAVLGCDFSLLHSRLCRDIQERRKQEGRGGALQGPQVPAPLLATTTGHSENPWG